MNSCVFRILIAGLCAIAGVVLGLWHAFASSPAQGLGWFLGMVYLGAFFAPNADDAACLFNGLRAKGE